MTTLSTKMYSSFPLGITAKDLRELLTHIPDEVVLVINGTVPTGVERLCGKIVEGYSGPNFQENYKGNPDVRYKGFTFTHLSEDSDGNVRSTHYF